VTTVSQLDSTKKKSMRNAEKVLAVCRGKVFFKKKGAVFITLGLPVGTVRTT
jgi:hypothetical protein